MKKPRRLTFDETRVPLSRLERFVLERVDGELSVTDIVELTGLAAPQVEQIMTRLCSQGAIELDEAPSMAHLDELLADAPIADPREVLDEVPADSGIDDYAVLVEHPRSSRPAPRPTVPTTAAPADRSAPPEVEPPTPDEPGPSLVPAEGDVTDPVQETTDEAQGNWRKLYETQLRQLSVAERIHLARTESGPTLGALCFDQDPQVVRGILENDRMNLDHARTIAAHHLNPVGLDAICARVSLLQDARVQRMLLRNVQLSESLVRRVLQPKRLLEIYKASIDRDIPERTRATARALFRAKFGVSSSEEKFEIIWSTEGRVLPQLVGVTIDQKTAAMFCARNITSVMLIQSLARWPATPPGVLAHILRQPMVVRQVHLRNMVLQHPNVPSEAKRRV